MKYLLLLFLALAAVAGCSVLGDPYTGEFASSAGGEAFIKVTKQNGEYAYSTMENGKWDTPRPMRVVDEKEYAYVVGSDCAPCMKGAIATEVVMLLRVNKGAYCERIPFETDYMFISFLGIDFLYKLR